MPLLDRSDRDGAVAAPREAGSAQHFRDAATPEAYRLAAHLAAVTPLSVPVMRLVQREVPAARPSHLAEVFLGGLIRPHPAPVPGPLPAKHRVFDFSEDAKAVLLHAVPQAELLRTNRLIGRRLEELAGRSPDFPSWLAHPRAPPNCPPHTSRSPASSGGCSAGSGCPSNAAHRCRARTRSRRSPKRPTTGDRSPARIPSDWARTRCAAGVQGGARCSTGRSPTVVRMPCCGSRGRTGPPRTRGCWRWRRRR
ncbi:hypothetical protein F3K43_47910 [Streptomyces sp. LBUM 1476]|nr:hypothetical protein [Streptomyces sp. LBUM 1476]